MADAVAAANVSSPPINRRLTFVRWVRKSHGWFGLWGPAGTHEPDSAGLKIVPEYPAGTFARWKVGALGADAIKYVIDPCPGQLAPKSPFADGEIHEYDCITRSATRCSSARARRTLRRAGG